jgi:hypothetical protein
MIESLPANSGDCYWCWHWDHKRVPATSRYLPVMSVPWVNVCARHLDTCGPHVEREGQLPKET